MAYAAYEQASNSKDGLALSYDDFHADVIDAYDTAMQNADNTAGLDVLKTLSDALGVAIDKFLMSAKLDLDVTWEAESCTSSGDNDESASATCNGHVVQDGDMLSTLQADIYDAKKTNLHDQGEAGVQDAAANIAAFATAAAGHIHTFTKAHEIVTKSDTTAGTSAADDSFSGGKIDADGKGDGTGEGGTEKGLTAGKDADLDAAIKAAYVDTMDAGSAPSGAFADLANPDVSDPDKLALAKAEVINKILAKGVCDGVQAYFESITAKTDDEMQKPRTVLLNLNTSSGIAAPSATEGTTGTGTGTVS